MTVCFSRDGNVVQLVSPAGEEHVRSGIFLEGYTLCASGFAPSYDAADLGTSGFTNSVILDGLPQPITVQRQTTTGSMLRLTQKLARDTNERDISITMTVTNLSTSQIRTGVRLDRYMDIDANGSPNNVFIKDRDTVFGFNPSQHGVSLNHTQFPSISHTTSIQTFMAFNPAACNQASVTVPAIGDHVARISYSFGSIGPGASKNVKIYYRRQ